MEFPKDTEEDEDLPPTTNNNAHGRRLASQAWDKNPEAHKKNTIHIEDNNYNDNESDDDEDDDVEGNKLEVQSENNALFFSNSLQNHQQRIIDSARGVDPTSKLKHLGSNNYKSGSGSDIYLAKIDLSKPSPGAGGGAATHQTNSFDQRKQLSGRLLTQKNAQAYNNNILGEKNVQYGLEL